MKVLGIMNMNKILGFSLLAASVATSFQAAAASTDLTITGAIVEGSCSLDVSNNGQYDNGDIKNNDLTAEGIKLPIVTQTMDLVCPAPTYISLAFTDNREGSEYTATSIPGGINGSYSDKIGLGFDSRGNPIGYAGLAIIEAPVVNGTQGYMMNSLDSGVTWQGHSIGPTAYFGLARIITGTDDASAKTTPAPITTMSLNTGMTAFIAPKSAIDTSTEINLDGSVTAEIFYL
jgi:type 1 fimbria pilin